MDRWSRFACSLCCATDVDGDYVISQEERERFYAVYCGDDKDCKDIVIYLNTELAFSEPAGLTLFFIFFVLSGLSSQTYEKIIEKIYYIADFAHCL